MLLHALEGKLRKTTSALLWAGSLGWLNHKRVLGLNAWATPQRQQRFSQSATDVEMMHLVSMLAGSNSRMQHYG